MENPYPKPLMNHMVEKPFAEMRQADMLEHGAAPELSNLRPTLLIFAHQLPYIGLQNTEVWIEHTSTYSRSDCHR